MKFTLTLLLGVIGCLYAAPTSPSTGPSAAVIIKLNSQSRPSSVASFLQTYNERSPSFRAEGVNEIKYEYNENFFNGVAGTFTPEFLAALQMEHGVEYVEEDGTMYALGQQENPPSWGMTRVSQRKLDLSKPFVYPDQGGEGVEAYIIDTGITPDHPDFEGRATMLKSFVNETNPNDGHGHGTHVAGTIGSKTYGIAKKAHLFGVKVLGANGSGTYSSVIAGIQLVAERAKPGKTVANMSLGGGKSKAVDDAVNAAVSAGVVMVVAAGNSAADACNTSPAGASSAFTVGSTDKTDQMSSFSNRGSCVKLFSPGRDITSTWLNSGTKTISGTSMATPGVVGVAAVYMSMQDFPDPQSVYKKLLSSATKNVVTNLDAKSPNLLVYLGDQTRSDTPDDTPADQ